jgi:hypothetical protein
MQKKIYISVKAGGYLMPYTTELKAPKKEKNNLTVSVKVIRSGNSGLRDAYRFLAKKIIEKEQAQCGRQSMSE